jgi:putative hydrolase of the HAD superfamily
MLRGVLFDFNGTLARLSSWGTPHHTVFARHNLLQAATRWGDGWLAEPADGEVHKTHSRSRDSYHRWELDRLRSRARACGVPEAQIDPLVHDLDWETKAISMEPYEDVVDTLLELLRRDVTIAVCSNWYWDLDKAIEQVGLAGMFATVVTSARAGMRKPDPRIYQHTLRQCDLQPGEALYVGDMWIPDVEGPRAMECAQPTGGGRNGPGRTFRRRCATGSGVSPICHRSSTWLKSSAAQPVQDIAGDAVNSFVTPSRDDHRPVGSSRGEDRAVSCVDAHGRRSRPGGAHLPGGAIPVTFTYVVEVFMYGLQHRDSQDEEGFWGAIGASRPRHAVPNVAEGGPVALVSDQWQTRAEHVRHAAVGTITQAGALVYPVVGVLHGEPGTGAVTGPLPRPHPTVVIVFSGTPAPDGFGAHH